MEAAYDAGATDIAAKISKQLNKDLNKQAEYYASLGELTKHKLQEVLMELNRRRYMEQMQQKDFQSTEYLNNSLSPNQLGLVQEIRSVFGIIDYVKQVEDKYNPKAPKDTSIFFQAEVGIRDGTVTGVQTCALPISAMLDWLASELRAGASRIGMPADRSFRVDCAVQTPLGPRDEAWRARVLADPAAGRDAFAWRSEERRVGKVCRGGGARDDVMM